MQRTEFVLICIIKRKVTFVPSSWNNPQLNSILLGSRVNYSSPQAESVDTLIINEV